MKLTLKQRAELKAREARLADAAWVEDVAQVTVQILRTCSGVSTWVEVKWVDEKDAAWAERLEEEMKEEIEAAVERVIDTRDKIRARVSKALDDDRAMRKAFADDLDRELRERARARPVGR